MEHWFTKTPQQITSELLSAWKLDELIFVGKYIRKREASHGSFVDVRTLDYVPLSFPAIQGLGDQPLWVFTTHQESLEVDKQYIFKAVLQSKERRLNGNNPFLMKADFAHYPVAPYNPSPKEFIQRRYDIAKRTPLLSDDQLSKSIETIKSEINKQPETFIYELLQNADDYPVVESSKPFRKTPVKVRFEIKDDYLILTHTGAPFKVNNVHAICGVNEKDKADDTEKIGFKGIGFKSVFKDCDYVLINSGGYQFRFDKSHHLTKTYWETIPIWTEQKDVKISNTELFWNEPVGFVLKPRSRDVLHNEETGYIKTLHNIFADPRILLFLRHLDQVVVCRDGSELICSKDFSNWWKKEYPAVVPETEKKWLNDRITSDTLRDKRIPDKFLNLSKSNISFATRRLGSQIKVTDDATVFVYLPTRINLKFPFLINGDFIPDGSREELHDIQWNVFLMRQAGQLFVSWIIDIGQYKVPGRDEFYFRRDYLNQLLLNFDDCLNSTDKKHHKLIEAFREGFLESINGIAFIPDHTGLLRKTEDILIDQTGLYRLLGEEFITICGISQVPIHPAISKNSAVIHLIKTDGKLFDKNCLLGLLNEEKFTQWLKEPSHNANFIKLLNDKKWLEEFTDQKIFLNQDGQLCPANALFLDFGDDLALLSWLNTKYLHPEVYQEVTTILLSSIIPAYSPVDFIRTAILENKSEVDSLLDQKINNLNFYRYLFKHRGALPSDYFSEGNLFYFKVWGNHDGEEYIISFENDLSLYAYNSTLIDLINGGVFPPDHFCLLSTEFAEKPEDQPVWNDFWKRFNVKQYVAEDLRIFFQTEIVVAIGKLNTHYNSYDSFNDEPSASYLERQQSSVILWQYIAETLPKLPPDEQKQAQQKLKQLVVFTTKLDKAVPLQKCFLSQQYTDNSAIEDLATEHSLSDLFFVTDLYLKNGSFSKEKWRKLFKDCHAREDEHEVVEQHLIPYLDGISGEKLLNATQLIFAHRDRFEKQPELFTKLKVKTISGLWVETKHAFLGSHYTQVELLDTILPSVQLPNVLSNEYTNGKQVDKWSSFFLKLGVKNLTTESEIINQKIDYVLANQPTINSTETNVTLVSEIFMLHADKKLTEPYYDKLRNLNLLVKSTNTETLLPARQCHLSSIYSPHLDLEQLLPESVRPAIFISPDYQRLNYKAAELKGFLKKIGINDDFKSDSIAILKRADLPFAYRTYIDQQYKTIRENAVSWSNQHRVEPWYTLSYSAFLKYSLIAYNFWQKILRDESFRNKVLAFSQYKYHFGPTKVINGIVYELRTSNAIPTSAGTCAHAQSLFSYKFKDFIDDQNLIPGIDLTGITVEGQSLEAWLGIRQKLALRFYLRRISQIQDFQQLKEVWVILIESIVGSPQQLDNEDLSELQKFIESSKLPNQQGNWQSVKQLHYIADDFKLGLGRYAGLIHDELVKLAPLFSVKKLTKADFKFKPKGDEREEEFKTHLFERLKYIAFAENQTTWPELLNSYKIKLAEISFLRTKQIAFSFGEGETAIHSTEENFLPDVSTVYYVGRWRESRAVRIFWFIHQTLGLTISEKQLTDLLLYEQVSQIIEFFIESGYNVPTEWIPIPKVNPRPEPPVANTRKTEQESIETEDRNEEELAEKKGRTEDERISDNKEAKTQVLGWLVQNGYECSLDSFDYDTIEGVVRKKDGAVFSVLVSSVKAGRLFFSSVKWLKLDAANTFLLVVGTSGKVTPYYLQQEVLEKYARTLLRVDNKYVDPDGLSAIADLHMETKSFQFIFYDAEAKFDAMFSNGSSPASPSKPDSDQGIYDFGDIL